MDSIQIVGLQISAKHGYYTEERLNGNNFEVDIEASLAQTYHRMAKPDDTFDYEEAANVVRDVFAGETKLFIEELALCIGSLLWAKYQAKLANLSIKVRKMNPPVCLTSSYSEVSLCWPRSI
jgi:dihydroneopterin aldolase